MMLLQLLAPRIGKTTAWWPGLMVALVLALGFAANPARAESTWFVVLGDISDPSATTIAVDPVPQSVNGAQRIMLIRVNRPVERVTRDGVRFRSFQSSVLFDCTQKTARFVSVDFYLQPLWAGEAYKSVTYPPTDVRSMEFREVNPNPRDRIIRAACLSSGSGSTSAPASTTPTAVTN